MRIGSKHSKKTKQKMRENYVVRLNENHPNWKGDQASKKAMHNWVIRRKGKASEHKCLCGKQAHDWANKDHSYKRSLDDYMALCCSCHIKYDIQYNNRKN